MPTIDLRAPKVDHGRPDVETVVIDSDGDWVAGHPNTKSIIVGGRGDTAWVEVDAVVRLLQEIGVSTEEDTPGVIHVRMDGEDHMIPTRDDRFRGRTFHEEGAAEEFYRKIRRVRELCNREAAESPYVLVLAVLAILDGRA